MSYQSYISQALQGMYKKRQQQQGYGQSYQGGGGYLGFPSRQTATETVPTGGYLGFPSRQTAPQTPGAIQPGGFGGQGVNRTDVWQGGAMPTGGYGGAQPTQAPTTPQTSVVSEALTGGYGDAQPTQQGYVPTLGEFGQYLPDYSSPAAVNYYANWLFGMKKNLYAGYPKAPDDSKIMGEIIQNLMKANRFSETGNFPIRFTPNKAWWGIPGNVSTEEVK